MSESNSQPTDDELDNPVENAVDDANSQADDRSGAVDVDEAFADGIDEPRPTETPEPPVAKGDYHSALEETVNKYKETIKTLTEDRDKYLETARRSVADFQNYQRRVARDIENERKYAIRPLVGDLLPVLDNLERALESAEKKPDDAKGLIDGVTMILKHFQDTLGKHEITMLDPVGEPFDPNLHEAITQHPSEEHPPMTVLLTVEKGYLLDERVIRPAKVVVSSAPS